MDMAKVGLNELCFKEITRSTKGSFAQSQLFDEEAKPVRSGLYQSFFRTNT
jgi:hypothetical protein